MIFVVLWSIVGYFCWGIFGDLWVRIKWAETSLDIQTFSGPKLSSFFPTKRAVFFPTKHAKQELFLPRTSMALWGVGVAGLGKLYFRLFLLIMCLAAQADFWIAGRKSWLNFSSFEFSYAEALRDDYTHLLNPNSFFIFACNCFVMCPGTHSANTWQIRSIVAFL